MAAPELKESVIVRSATTADAAAITQIDAEQTGAAKPEHWKAYIEDLGSRGGIALVAVVEGRVVGFILGEVRAWEFGSPPTGWVYAVGVAGTQRRSSVGRLLLEGALEQFTKAEVKAVRTMVQRENVELLRFFRSAGFAAGPFVELEVEL